MSERKKSLIALLIITLALLLIGILEAWLRGATPPGPPQAIAQAVQAGLKYRDGVVLLWQVDGNSHWVLGNGQLLEKKFLPGSLMKLITAEAALRQGVDQHYRCEGHQDWPEGRQDCWIPKGHGNLDLPKALALSCNLYFSKLGDRLGWDPLLAVLAEYQLTPNPTLSRNAESLRKFAIGEAEEFSVTPKTVARFWQQYLKQIEQPKFQAIREGLSRAATEGTAKAAAGLGLPLLAKTGTAEAVGESYKTHGWFLGAYPADHPQWAVMIFLKNAHGYMEPAHLAGEIFQELSQGEAKP